MDQMTPRERIMATINRQPVDRRPVDLWCTPEVLDTIACPEFLDATIARIDAIQTVMLERMLKELHDELDIVFISDDMGMQNNLLISLESWETFFKARLKNWCDLIFHGGIENQRILPNGTASEVAEETLHCLQTLGKGGGYICCSCHNAQAGTPVENILAMIDTVKSYRE